MPTLYQASDREWAIFQSWNNICILFHKHPLDVVYANFKRKKTDTVGILSHTVICLRPPNIFWEYLSTSYISSEHFIIMQGRSGDIISISQIHVLIIPMMSTSICAQTIHTVLYLHKGNCQGSFTTMIKFLGFHVGNESHNEYLSEHLACITYISPD